MHDDSLQMMGKMDNAELRATDWVEVRSREEILATLDHHGRLEELPFMPEMFEFCGKQFRVFRRAHKTCDPPNGISGRRMLHSVHLENVRCNGAGHGNCQARCLIFWKEAWLKPISTDAGPGDWKSSRQSSEGPGCATEADVLAGTRSSTPQSNANEPEYVCQSTQLAQATVPLPWWDWRQYMEDYRSGNARFSQLVSSFLFFLFAQLVSAGMGFGSALRWAYDRIQGWREGTPYPMRIGKIARGAKTPSATLNLQPGELVKVRSYEEILATLDEDGRNHGMWFDAEMVPYCGGTYRVLDRVSTIINEKTGKMQNLKNDCIMLEQVVCRACYSRYRKFCPRSIYPYWREIWLERINPTELPAEESPALETIAS